VPECVQQLHSLQYLELRGSVIEELPAWIAALTRLTCLFLDGNKLTCLPDLTPLIRLHSLHLSANASLQPPAWIARMPALLNLEVAAVGLTTVPECFQHLHSLDMLNLSGNQIEVLPAWVAGLTSLETLELSRNHLTELPDLTSLTCLEVLCLDYNNITRLSKALVSMASLEAIEIEDNPLESPQYHAVHTQLLAQFDEDLRANEGITSTSEEYDDAWREEFPQMQLEAMRSWFRAEEAMASLLADEEADQTRRATKTAKKKHKKKKAAQAASTVESEGPTPLMPSQPLTPPQSPSALPSASLPSSSPSPLPPTEGPPSAELSTTARHSPSPPSPVCERLSPSPPRESTTPTTVITQEPTAKPVSELTVRLISREPPDELCCPISLELLLDPVVTSLGHCFDRTAMEVHLKKLRDEKQIYFCPLTKERMTKDLHPCLLIRNQAKAWLEANPDYF
jgi:hypothetical protein